MQEMTQTIAPSAVPATPRAIPSSPAAATSNFISEDVEIKGSLTIGGNLTTNAKINGQILASGLLTVGAKGRVEGDIQASAVAVHGIVKGNITVEDRCELKGDAELIGDLSAPRLVIEEGVTFVGNVRVMPKGQTVLPLK
jgi:cytoskeletal protein CcmA (bactofilin family)